MPREIKAYEKRKAEMVAAAWSLFSEKGYDRTTVNAIIEKLGVSKGTFYHYFTSKEDILDAVVDSITEAGFQVVAPILEDAALSAIDKLNQYIKAARAWRLTNIDAIKEVMRIIYRDENIIIRHKMHAHSVSRVAPLFTQLIQQGINEGVFKNEYPEETAEALLHLSNILGDANAKLFLDLAGRLENRHLIKRRINFYGDMLERLLGAPKGSIESVSDEFIEKILQ